MTSVLRQEQGPLFQQHLMSKAWAPEDVSWDGYSFEAHPVGPKPKTARRKRNYDNAVCQVEGCDADLSVHKEYHQRYKICEYHLRVSSIFRDGVQQRFCQQCGCFHVLEKFDDNKRSCRAKLQRHNERRRKPPKADPTTSAHPTLVRSASVPAPDGIVAVDSSGAQLLAAAVRVSPASTSSKRTPSCSEDSSGLMTTTSHKRARSPQYASTDQTTSLVSPQLSIPHELSSKRMQQHAVPMSEAAPEPALINLPSFHLQKQDVSHNHTASLPLPSYVPPQLPIQPNIPKLSFNNRINTLDSITTNPSITPNLDPFHLPHAQPVSHDSTPEVFSQSDAAFPPSVHPSLPFLSRNAHPPSQPSFSQPFFNRTTLPSIPAHPTSLDPHPNTLCLDPLPSTNPKPSPLYPTSAPHSLFDDLSHPIAPPLPSPTLPRYTGLPNFHHEPSSLHPSALSTLPPQDISLLPQDFNDLSLIADPFLHDPYSLQKTVDPPAAALSAPVPNTLLQPLLESSMIDPVLPTSDLAPPTSWTQANSLLDSSLPPMYHQWERLTTISLKLFNCTPSELPVSLRQDLILMIDDVQLIEGYIRPGCVLLTVDMFMPPMARELHAAELAQRLANLPGFWKSCSLLAQDINSAAAMCAGAMAPVESLLPDAATLQAPRIVAMSPVCLHAPEGQEVTLRCLSARPQTLRVLCRANGEYLEPDRVVVFPEEGGGTDGMAALRVSLVLPEDIPGSFVKVEAVDGDLLGRSQALLVVRNQAVASEVNQLLEARLCHLKDGVLPDMGRVLDLAAWLREQYNAVQCGVHMPQAYPYSAQEVASVVRAARQLLALCCELGWRNTFMTVVQIAAIGCRAAADVLEGARAASLLRLPLLHMAVRSRCPNMVQFLLDWGIHHGVMWQDEGVGPHQVTALQLARMLDDGGRIADILAEVLESSEQGSLFCSSECASSLHSTSSTAPDASDIIQEDPSAPHEGPLSGADHPLADGDASGQAAINSCNDYAAVGDAASAAAASDPERSPADDGSCASSSSSNLGGAAGPGLVEGGAGGSWWAGRRKAFSGEGKGVRPGAEEGRGKGDGSAADDKVASCSSAVDKVASCSAADDEWAVSCSSAGAGGSGSSRKAWQKEGAWAMSEAELAAVVDEEDEAGGLWDTEKPALKGGIRWHSCNLLLQRGKQVLLMCTAMILLFNILMSTLAVMVRPTVRRQQLRQKAAVRVGEALMQGGVVEVVGQAVQGVVDAVAGALARR